MKFLASLLIRYLFLIFQNVEFYSFAASGATKDVDTCAMCLEDCSSCNWKECMPCFVVCDCLMDDNECAKCEQDCKKCIGCSGCLTNTCDNYEEHCGECGHCLPCMSHSCTLYQSYSMTDPGAEICEECDSCYPCLHGLGCFEQTKHLPRLLSGYKEEL